MLKRPGMLNMPNAATSLFGGNFACSANTCTSGYGCNEVDSSSGGGGCETGFAIGGIIVGAGAGALVGILIT